MCGFVGLINLKRHTSVSGMQEVIKRMNAQLRHRGPDDEGEWIDSEVGIALAHTRLSVLDLTSSGHQPMHDKNKRYVLVYNGEIYNYRLLKSELISLGSNFSGTSDTEVVIASFRQWGVKKSLEKFVGMFSLAFWDRKRHILYLARDRFGEKPLYYGWTDKSFIFGSELKAFKAHPRFSSEIDRDALSLFFKHNYVPGPYSIYKNIFKLIPGTFLKLETDNIVDGYCPEPQHYWSLSKVALSGCKARFKGNELDAVHELNRLIEASIKGQMISDVPIGAFLSGGIDSSTVVSIMQAESARPIKTFTIGFDDPAYNEANQARRISRHLGTDHHELILSPRDAIDVIPILPKLFDEPFADSSQIPTYLVSQFAKNEVTVSLSGDGGDEVFCGYNRHVALLKLWRQIGWIPQVIRHGFGAGLKTCPSSLFENLLRKKRFGILADQVQKMANIIGMKDPEQMYINLNMFWDQKSLVKGGGGYSTIFDRRNDWPDLPDYIDRLMYLQYITSLPDDMLVKLDRAAMGVSLESRVPLLDHRIVEFAWTLPFEMKVHNGVGKWILRNVLNQHIPQKYFDQPKTGFAIPIDTWLKGPLRDWAESLLNRSKLLNDGYLEPGLVREKWKEHLSGKKKWQWHIWGVLMFQAWLKNERENGNNCCIGGPA